MISVAHGKDYRVIRRAVLALQNGFVAELFGSLCKLFGVGYEPAGDAATVLHQLKVIDLFAFRDGGENDVIRIIHEYHDVRHLKRRVAADTDARRQPVLNGVLGSAYRAVRTLDPVIGLKIEHAHYAAAHRTVFERALKVNIAVAVCFENALVDIALHRCVYLNAFGFGVL